MSVLLATLYVSYQKMSNYVSGGTHSSLTLDVTGKETQHTMKWKVDQSFNQHPSRIIVFYRQGQIVE